MIINELPEKILINIGEIQEDWVEATVISIAPKLHFGAESGVEGFVAICYTSDKQIHEVFLNECKIVKTRTYDKTWDSRNSFKKDNRRQRKKDLVRNNYSAKREKFDRGGESD